MIASRAAHDRQEVDRLDFKLSSRSDPFAAVRSPRMRQRLLASSMVVFVVLVFVGCGGGSSTTSTTSTSTQTQVTLFELDLVKDQIELIGKTWASHVAAGHALDTPVTGGRTLGFWDKPGVIISTS